MDVAKVNIFLACAHSRMCPLRFFFLVLGLWFWLFMGRRRLRAPTDVVVVSFAHVPVCVCLVCVSVLFPRFVVSMNAEASLARSDYCCLVFFVWLFFPGMWCIPR